jgi:hypothetical protein
VRNTANYGLKECQGSARSGLTKGVIPTPTHKGQQNLSGDWLNLGEAPKLIAA